MIRRLRPNKKHSNTKNVHSLRLFHFLFYGSAWFSLSQLVVIRWIELACYMACIRISLYGTRAKNMIDDYQMYCAHVGVAERKIYRINPFNIAKAKPCLAFLVNWWVKIATLMFGIYDTNPPYYKTCSKLTYSWLKTDAVTFICQESESDSISFKPKLNVGHVL
jgi:hypothetical protein